jgi:hypothetical protein
MKPVAAAVHDANDGAGLEWRKPERCVHSKTPCLGEGAGYGVGMRVGIYWDVAGSIGMWRDLLGCGGIWWDVAGSVGTWRDLVGCGGICWDVAGYVGMWRDMLGCGGIWWDVAGYGGVRRHT